MIDLHLTAKLIDTTATAIRTFGTVGALAMKDVQVPEGLAIPTWVPLALFWFSIACIVVGAFLWELSKLVESYAVIFDNSTKTITVTTSNPAVIFEPAGSVQK